MRIVSLLPSATEIVCALGLEDALVGVTHECDYPAGVRELPVVTRSLLDHHDWPSDEIDHHVSRQLRDGLSLYELDSELLLELRPDLILTQSLCAVCAVSYGAVQRVVSDITDIFAPVAPRVLTLEPGTLADVLQTFVAVGAAAGVEQRAERLVAEVQARIERVRERVQQARTRPRVAFLEWLDPAFGPGHWMPELVELAGGKPGLGRAGAASRHVPWDDVIAFAPEVIVVAPCGFGVQRALKEAAEVLPRRHAWGALPAVRRGCVYVADGSAYFSRPGPRIAESLELLAELVHPELCDGWGPAGAWQRLVPQAVVADT
ncbi:MAG: cobalamin-binding protein [Chloroflexota bacterium]